LPLNLVVVMTEWWLDSGISAERVVELKVSERF
jgi:hypothetical protein